MLDHHENLAQAKERELHDYSVINIVPDSPQFDDVYNFLSRYFGPKGEFESVDIIYRRYQQKMDASKISAKFFMKAVMKDNQVVAARAHQIIVPPESAASNVPVIVFLMNIYVDESVQSKGIGKKLREAAKLDLESVPVGNRPVIYVAEMEPYDNIDAESKKRYTAYMKSGFRIVDPNNIEYYQLDNPNNKDGTKMNLLCTKSLNGAPWSEDTELSAEETQQIITALRYSYEEVGYAYNDTTSPKILINQGKYQTKEISVQD